MASALKVPRLYTHASRLILPLNTSPLFCSHPHPTSIFLRWASKQTNSSKQQEKGKKKRNTRTTYIQHDLREGVQFALVDAMRYIRAFEVGRDPTSPKYELAIRLRSLKNGPAIRNRLQLPHPVNTATRVAVICPTPSPIADLARAVGASIVGEDDLLASIKEGEINFDRLICHRSSAQKLNKASVGRILGPKGLMPSTKLGTVVADVARAVRGMTGGSEYREKLGVIRLAIGQLGFSPEQLQHNIKALMESVKKDAAQMSDKISKEIHEVVLSSTHAPGFSLNGDLKSATSLQTSDFTLANF